MTRSTFSYSCTAVKTPPHPPTPHSSHNLEQETTVGLLWLRQKAKHSNCDGQQVSVTSRVISPSISCQRSSHPHSWSLITVNKKEKRKGAPPGLCLSRRSCLTTAKLVKKNFNNLESSGNLQQLVRSFSVFSNVK